MVMVTAATVTMTGRQEEEGNMMGVETGMEEEEEVGVVEGTEMEGEEMEETMEIMEGGRTRREDDDITDMNPMCQFP